MGQALKKPVSTDSQEVIEREINRLLHSYSYLLKAIREKGKVEKDDEMKHSSIHHQWRIVHPLLHKSPEKQRYMETFAEYKRVFSVWKYRLTETLESIYEEPLL